MKFTRQQLKSMGIRTFEPRSMEIRRPKIRTTKIRRVHLRNSKATVCPSCDLLYGEDVARCELCGRPTQLLEEEE